MGHDVSIRARVGRRVVADLVQVRVDIADRLLAGELLLAVGQGDDAGHLRRAGARATVDVPTQAVHVRVEARVYENAAINRRVPGEVGDSAGVAADDPGLGILPRRAVVDRARSTAGSRGEPRLVPDRLGVTAVGVVLVTGVVVTRVGERHVTGRLPRPPVLELGPSDRRNPRTGCRPSDGRVRVGGPVPVWFGNAAGAVVAGRCKDCVVVGGCKLVDAIETSGLGRFTTFVFDPLDIEDDSAMTVNVSGRHHHELGFSRLCMDSDDGASVTEAVASLPGRERGA